MSYEPKLAAALSGATLRQLSHWRRASGPKGAVLVPEISSERPILYSFRDVVALRICVQLREEASLQKIRRALNTLREDLGEWEHISSYKLVAGPDTIYLAEPDHAVDLIKGGNVVIHQMVDVLAPFYKDGRSIPALLTPREHVAVDESVRGGEPVIQGTRIPASDVAALVRDGVPPDQISEFYPGVTAEAARDAADFSEYVDSYGSSEPRQVDGRLRADGPGLGHAPGHRPHDRTAGGSGPAPPFRAPSDRIGPADAATDGGWPGAGGLHRLRRPTEPRLGRTRRPHPPAPTDPTPASGTLNPRPLRPEVGPGGIGTARFGDFPGQGVGMGWSRVASEGFGERVGSPLAPRSAAP